MQKFMPLTDEPAPPKDYARRHPEGAAADEGCAVLYNLCFVVFF
jgi:hypothetical protein